MASTKQCKCETNSTAAHIRFVVDLDHHVPIKEGSAVAGAAADDDSASACYSVLPNEFSLSTSRNMEKSSSSYSSDSEGPSLPLGAEMSRRLGGLGSQSAHTGGRCFSHQCLERETKSRLEKDNDRWEEKALAASWPARRCGGGSRGGSVGRSQGVGSRALAAEEVEAPMCRSGQWRPGRQHGGVRGGSRSLPMAGTVVESQG
jgi:hypothetical protein